MTSRSVPTEERLHKLIAIAGIASRRHAEELIASGLVSVNGKVVTEQGTKADPRRDQIKVRGRLINYLVERTDREAVEQPVGTHAGASMSGQWSNRSARSRRLRERIERGVVAPSEHRPDERDALVAR